jgi:hypothetical protein
MVREAHYPVRYEPPAPGTLTEDDDDEDETGSVARPIVLQPTNTPLKPVSVSVYGLVPLLVVGALLVLVFFNPLPDYRTHLAKAAFCLGTLYIIYWAGFFIVEFKTIPESYRLLLLVACVGLVYGLWCVPCAVHAEQERLDLENYKTQLEYCMTNQTVVLEGVVADCQQKVRAYCKVLANGTGFWDAVKLERTLGTDNMLSISRAIGRTLAVTRKALKRCPGNEACTGEVPAVNYTIQLHTPEVMDVVISADNLGQLSEMGINGDLTPDKTLPFQGTLLGQVVSGTRQQTMVATYLLSYVCPDSETLHAMIDKYHKDHMDAAIRECEKRNETRPEDSVTCGAAQGNLDRHLTLAEKAKEAKYTVVDNALMQDCVDAKPHKFTLPPPEQPQGVSWKQVFPWATLAGSILVSVAQCAFAHRDSGGWFGWAGTLVSTFCNLKP